jgi:uncharacterized protein (TIGR03437 family)
LLAWLAVATLSSRVASAQPDSFIFTARSTKPALNSLRLLPDGTLLYSDAYGVYRVRGQQTDTLLTNPGHEAYCYARMFGKCLSWIPAVYHPKPTAANSHGTIYIADPEQHLIKRYDAASNAFLTLAANVGAPTSLAADDLGNLYFNDPDNCRVRRLSQGTLTTVAGTGVCGYTNDGGPATSAQILSVRAIALDASGQLFIADDKAGVVRRVDTDGIIMTIVGTGTPGRGGEGTPANQTPLNDPAALALDAQGNLYIAEAAGNRVRLVGPDGLIRTIAGTGVAGHAGDYGPANSAQLTSPACLALADSGALRICDSDRIRRLIPPAPGRWIIPVLDLTDSYPRSSPGAWLTLLGDFSGLPTMDWSNSIASDGSLPTSLAGVMADVSGKACVISYVSPDRIDLLLPQDLDPAYPGRQPMRLSWPGATLTTGITIVPARPAFLMSPINGKLYPAAATQDLSWITPDLPAHPGQTITLYATGLNLTAPIAPPYDMMQPSAMQLVLRSYGYPVLLARPFSPGVFELTVQLPSNLPPGEFPIRLVSGGFMSTAPTMFPVGGGN